MSKGIITTYRKKTNLTQRKVAELLGTSYQYISICEKTDKISEKYIERLAQILSVRPELLRKQLLPPQLRAETIKYYLKKKDLNLNQLSKQTNVYCEYIHNWVKGKIRLTKESDYYEIIKEALEIPDEIIFPDCVIHTEVSAVYELEDAILVFYITEKEKELYLDLATKYRKDTIFIHVTEKIPLLPDMPKGEIRMFPKMLSNTSQLYVIELENQLLIASNNANGVDTNTLQQETQKKIVNGQIQAISSAEKSLSEALVDKIMFRNEIMNVLKKHYREVQLIGKNTACHTYRCDGVSFIIRYKPLNDDIVKITSVSEKK